MMDVKLKTIITSNISPEKVCFWTGAGISANKPSCLPIGNSLTKEAIEHFCLEGTWDKLVEYFAKAKMKNSFGYPKSTPRLEAVLESMMHAIGTRALTILDPFFDAKPNSLHHFFAEHLENGGTHITMNFDNCIEKCLTSSNKVQIIHVHGKYNRENLEDLGVRITTIAPGLPERLKEEITSILRQQRYLIFAGYGGRDFFDVNPYFFELKERREIFENLVVIWVKHAHGDTKGNLVPYTKQQDGRVILEALRNCGAKIFYLLMQTDKFLEIFQEIWGFSYKDNEPSDKGCDEQRQKGAREIQFCISEDDKVLTTAQLYSSMGVGREIVELKNDLLGIVNKPIGENSLKSKVYFLLNNGLRDVGLYKQVMSFTNLLPISTLKEKIFFHQRAAGDHWLRGDHIRAAYHFYKGIVAYGKKIDELKNTNEENQSATEVYYESIITFLHWYRDIKRLPLIGGLFPLWLSIRAFQRLTQAREYLSRNPHSMAKLIRLYDEIPRLKGKVTLPPWIKPAEVEIATYFQETDSILGVINFSRREIILEIHTGKMPGKDELELLYSRSKLIGDRPGMLKAALLLKEIYRSEEPIAKTILKEIEWVRLKKIGWLLKWYWSDLKRLVQRG